MNLSCITSGPDLIMQETIFNMLMTASRDVLNEYPGKRNVKEIRQKFMLYHEYC